MRSFRTVLLAAASLVLVPALAQADDIATQLQAMQERMDQLEERLEATGEELDAANDRVEQQEVLINEAGLADPSGSSSSLMSFVDTIEMSGWLSVSWWYNFNNPDNDDATGGNIGRNAIANPFNPDTHQFSFDQLWFSMERPIDEENRAGFVADIVFGKTAGLAPDGNSGGLPGARGAGGNNLYLNQAYIQYLIPNSQVTAKAGKFGTLIGAETVAQPGNLNISRGFVFQLLQPIDHVGILFQGDIGESGWDWGLGAVNDVFETQPISTKGYGITGHLGYAQDTWSINVEGIYGNATGGLPPGEGLEAQNTAIVDVILTWDPTERFTTYVNFDYLWDNGAPQNGGNNDPAWAWGIAWAGRYAITERFGAAARLEYVNDRRQLFGFDNNLRVWSSTLTLDYALTDQLVVRGEYRYDGGSITDTVNNEIFVSGRSGAFDRGSQNLLGVEAIYAF